MVTCGKPALWISADTPHGRQKGPRGFRQVSVIDGRRSSNLRIRHGARKESKCVCVVQRPTSVPKLVWLPSDAQKTFYK